MTTTNWRTINVDALDPESSYNFDLSTLTPQVAPVSSSSIAQLGNQVRTQLRSGDAEGALRLALSNPPYGADDAGKEAHLASVVECLQSVKLADVSRVLERVYSGEGGVECLDVLVKYLYKGMAQSSSGSGSGPLSPRIASPQSTGFSQIQSRAPAEGGGQAMSVLLSWHEKVIEIAGQGAIIRVMTDRRTV